MGRGFYFLLVILGTALHVFAQSTWEDPYFLDPGNIDGVDFDPSNPGQVNFNEELPLNTAAVKLNYKGPNRPYISSFPTPPFGDTYLGPEFVQDSDEFWVLTVTKRQDYEATHYIGNPNYFFWIDIEGMGTQNFNIIIINIDDNSPTIEPLGTNCIIDEGPLEDIDINALECFYRIHDLDGHMVNITQEIIPEPHENIQEIFEFIPVPPGVPTDVSIREMTMSLIPKSALDFEATSIYILTWEVRDTQPDKVTTLRVVVEVNDLPDTAPVWTTIFASQQFDEKSEQTFSVTAIDGDIMIDDAITYDITVPDDDWKDLISIDTTSGLIEVQPIDRDKFGRETFIFTVIAREANVPNYDVQQTITFLINDLNDNAAEIEVDGDNFILLLDESTVATIDRRITVTDRDLGVNAQYTIELRNSPDRDNIMYHEAFSVAPTSGYQVASVSIFITDPNSLDYENESWREFTFDLVTTGLENDTHIRSVTFQVNLINLNDEVPIFQTCNDHKDSTEEECVVEIPETHDGDAFLVNMTAIDRDVDDNVTHRLLGAYAQRILSIDNSTGEIRTQLIDGNGPFDYETLQEIIIQVQATDNLIDKNGARNTAVSQLTIRLTDVNDETPYIRVGSTLAAIDENLDDGVSILEGFVIEASDDDTDAYLELQIDWDKTIARKNGADIEDAFVKYEGCIRIETIGPTGSACLPDTIPCSPVTAKLTIVETVPGNTPDYEEFDTLHLTIVATDTKQAVNDNSSSVTIPILINDLNDNPPVFDIATIESSKSVSENSLADVMIAVVTATDEDIGTRITYSLEPRNGTEEGLVRIVESTGQIIVDGARNIDADDPPLYFLYYNVVASDGKHSTRAEIVISVLDVNDNPPVFPDSDAKLKVPEKTEHDTEIYKFEATDADRDEINHAIVYRFRESSSSLQYRNYFSVDENSGKLSVWYATDLELDRDEEIPAINFTIEIVASNTDRDALSTFTELAITLTDINDQTPELTTDRLTASEDMKVGERVGEITANDRDDPASPNSHVTFKIENIEAVDRTFDEPLDDLFILNNINAESRTAELFAGQDLEDKYGDFKVTIWMQDMGQDNQNDNTSDLVVTVNKFNFRAPSFINPTQGETIYLSMNQRVGFDLVVFGETEATLPDLSATDNQGNKFNFIFSIVEDARDLFIIGGSADAALRIRRELTTEDYNTIFPLRLRVDTDGQPLLSAEISIGIVFVNDQADPIFEKTEIDLKDHFVEEEEGNQQYAFEPADYQLEDINIPLPVHYIIQDSDSPFTIPDSLEPTLHLDKALDREDGVNNGFYTVNIQAGKTPSMTNPSDPRSVLTINIELNDINDHSPKFDQEEYYAIFHSDESVNTVIFQMTATDEDRDSVIKYEMNEKNVENAVTFPNFDIDSANGEVSLKSAPTSGTSGYAVQEVTASDGSNSDIAELRIYHISQTEHIVKFVFLNTRDDCRENLQTIGQVLTTFFADEHYQASAKGCLDVVDENGSPILDEIIAEVYFIDTQDNVPVPSAQIERFANDIPIFQNLARSFLNVGLNLMSFSTTTEDEDNTVEVLRAWLIGVAVVLGALCILLLVAFILKTRSLTNRLNKLSVTKYASQDSGLNRKIMPNTNRHAVSGANPVFNTENTVPEFDTGSIGSGDSDLVGVEDNPEFEYTPPKTNGVTNPA